MCVYVRVSARAHMYACMREVVTSILEMHGAICACMYSVSRPFFLALGLYV